MQNRFFSNNAAKYLSINYEGFIHAVEKNDIATMDFMLEAKNNGAQLDFNNYQGINLSRNALEILLERRDFFNASKLLKAGADTGITKKEWVSDDGPYPYGGYETKRVRDFFQVFAKDKDVIDFLKKEVPDKYIQYKYGDSYLNAKKAYEEAKKQLEVIEADIQEEEGVECERKNKI